MRACSPRVSRYSRLGKKLHVLGEDRLGALPNRAEGVWAFLERRRLEPCSPRATADGPGWQLCVLPLDLAWFRAPLYFAWLTKDLDPGAPPARKEAAQRAHVQHLLDVLSGMAARKDLVGEEQEIDEQIFGSAPPEELAAAIAEEIAREDAAVPEDGSSSEAEIAKSSSGSDLHSQYSPDLHSQHSSSR